MTSENAGPIEHQNVPQAHRGLHDLLYSSNDEHGAEPTAAPALENVAETPMTVQVWCEQAQNAKVAGVYAVMDGDRHIQFIGYSRNVSLSLRSHLTQKGEAVCAWVKVQTFKFPKRDAMEALRD